MKKLSSISNQIKSNTFSYTGKGAFEAIVNKHQETIKQWLENLIPLQKQIEELDEMEGVEFQKRNYTRILTKLFPEEYTEFVSLNILVRDAHTIAQHYQDDYNLTTIYQKLIDEKFLKYPGKYEKYVEFGIFQKFVMMYRDELISSLNEEVSTTNITPTPTTPVVEEDVLAEETPEETITQEATIEETPIVEEEVEEVKPEKKETNWTNLLLGKLK